MFGQKLSSAYIFQKKFLWTAERDVEGRGLSCWVVKWDAWTLNYYSWQGATYIHHSGSSYSKCLPLWKTSKNLICLVAHIPRPRVACECGRYIGRHVTKRDERCVSLASNKNLFDTSRGQGAHYYPVALAALLSVLSFQENTLSNTANARFCERLLLLISSDI